MIFKIGENKNNNALNTCTFLILYSKFSKYEHTLVHERESLRNFMNEFISVVVILRYRLLKASSLLNRLKTHKTWIIINCVYVREREKMKEWMSESTTMLPILTYDSLVLIPPWPPPTLPGLKRSPNSRSWRTLRAGLGRGILLAGSFPTDWPRRGPLAFSDRSFCSRPKVCIHRILECQAALGRVGSWRYE